jgi:hypothetical protein
MAIVFASGCQKTQMVVEPQKTKFSEAESREVFKAERLGEELYLQDAVAAKASRLMIQTVGPIKPGELSGWIVVKDGAKNLTRFIKQTGETINVVYDVRLDFKGEGEVTKDNLTPLSKTELAMFRARHNAVRAAPKDCAQAYNTAVMEDIDSNGWLVYVLAATKENAIVVGGHSRVKVSADGNNVLAVTPLYKSCLTIPIPTDSNNAKQEALYVSYPVADIPSEIHVYLNRLYGYPVYVTTARGNWLVKDGRILLLKPPEKTQETGKPQQKK